MKTSNIDDSKKSRRIAEAIASGRSRRHHPLHFALRHAEVAAHKEQMLREGGKDLGVNVGISYILASIAFDESGIPDERDRTLERGMFYIKEALRK